MIESLIMTLFPISFLIILIRSGENFRRKNINMDGEPPIERRLFLTSKYLIVLVWTAAALHSWGVILPFNTVQVPKWLSLFLWIAGFCLLYIGRSRMGSSFRIGSPQEATDLKSDGLFRFSRNPMYVGVYSTILGASLYTSNPLVLFTALFIILVHHKIVLAEEQFLQKVFGEEYTQYCSRVRRYI
jgi:protein-S-isoprenylcysteine O-methyltransferase Ste14